jgi:hypothetical protein
MEQATTDATIQFIIHSLSKKSYVTSLPTHTLANVRTSILNEWDVHQYPPQFNFEVNELLISTRQEVHWLVGDVVEKEWRVDLVEIPEEETHVEAAAMENEGIISKSPAKHNANNLEHSPRKQTQDTKKSRKSNHLYKMCKVEGCTNLRQGKASLGVCKLHGAIKMICKKEGCERSVKARGLCHRHWMQVEKEKGEL